MLSFLEKKLDSTQNIVIVADSLNRPMEIKLLKKYGDQITAIYYSEKNNKGKLKIQALEYPEI